MTTDCVGCGRPVEGRRVCSACRKRGVHATPASCPHCAWVALGANARTHNCANWQPGGVSCIGCGRSISETRRGQVCSSCGQRGYRTGPPRRRVADTLAEYDHLTAAGEAFDQIAARLGIKPASLARALMRAGRTTLRKAG